jgi:hypothetical protein
MSSMKITVLLTVLLIVLCLAGLGSAQTAPQKAAVPANLYPIQEGFVDANGAMTYYWVMGHGTPLVIVHGGPGASHD